MSASTIEYGQLPALLLRAPDGAEATITLYGAHLVSWKPISGTAAPAQERMFMSRLSALDGRRAIRGGVPVIFPQFAERGEGMRHGFARTSTWRVLDSGEEDGAAFAVLGLNQADLSPQASSAWAYPFELALRVSVHAASLAMTLEVRNTGTHPFPFAAALHTYHLVDDVEAVRIEGVQAETLAVTDKLDQVFTDIAGPIRFDNGADELLLRQSGFTDAVVWNPGAADAAALADMEDEEYRNFVCIEPALLGPLTLAPGGVWRGEYQISPALA
ncbi:Putative glucose-6-phosphate 1-epimerase [Massilia sp. Bi118]|uniref:D-hexose-6-phosphate mutarotase n=1 Tax=Massilia sp. Bi118 TaxID=2822346 RepID=UPI001DD3B3B2|nr:D-hexose-6-phosphate mutarotase [Massilia sp. Bi118]CAH0134712.1 Putative glucose-6-phosphate 1-epimerase [Massilia sp. Bi118]